MCDYVNMRRKVYGDDNGWTGDAVFVPVCSICGRFVKADEFVDVGERGLRKQPNATCSRCGRVEMLFEGFI